VGLASTNLYQITATNTNATTLYSASNLPTGVTNVNPTNGIISGTPTIEGNYNTTVFASRIITSTNGTNVTTNTLVGSKALLFSVAAQVPVIASPTTAAGTNNEAFTIYQAAVTPTNAATFGMTTNLPPGLTWDAFLGTISGTPVITNVFTNTLYYTNTLFATNSGGSTSTNLVISIAPAIAPLARYATAHGLSGTNATIGTDPDRDGFANGTEFAFGMNPSAKDIIPTRAVQVGKKLKLLWNRRTNTSEVVYVVESAPSLVGATWSSVSVTPQLDSDGTTVPSGYQRVSVLLDPPTTGGRFYRVRAVVQPGASLAP
jgi:hypothetical protein